MGITKGSFDDTTSEPRKMLKNMNFFVGFLTSFGDTSKIYAKLEILRTGFLVQESGC
jgi:hypothetical protein